MLISLLRSRRAVDSTPSDGLDRSEDLLNENLLLRARVKQLESLIATESDAGVNLRGENSTGNHFTSSPQLPEDVVTIFEGLHLGQSAKEIPDNITIVSDAADERILSLLPIRESSLKIVRFSLAVLGWVHCAVNVPKFLSEHDAFWNYLEANNKIALRNHGWLPVYLSILAVSPSNLSSLRLLTFQGWCIFYGRRDCQRSPLHS
jgi:hypothetical protein